jgi:hypothetical protein
LGLHIFEICETTNQLVNNFHVLTLTCEAHKKLEEFDSAHGEAVVGLLKSSLPPGEANLFLQILRSASLAILAIFSSFPLFSLVFLK